MSEESKTRAKKRDHSLPRGSLLKARDRANSMLKVVKTRATGRAFSCRALSGESDYSICVNSDMTVSCNCADRDGQGQIGDLRTQDLQEIFDGEAAGRLRRELAAGVLPLPFCQSCSELRAVKPKEAERHVALYGPPKRGIMVENTSLCNLKCTYCGREEIKQARKDRTMTLEDMERVAQVVKQHGIERISFFNLGEPFLSPRVLQELRVIRAHNPDVFIRCSTNGLLLDTDEKRQAALLTDDLMVSIDGATTEVVRKYQLGGNFEDAYRNMADLVAYRDAAGLDRPQIDWKYVVFRWNDQPEHIERAIALAREAGVDGISFWPGYAAVWEESLRYKHHPYFKNLGEKQLRWRRIDLKRESV